MSGELCLADNNQTFLESLRKNCTSSESFRFCAHLSNIFWNFARELHIFRNFVSFHVTPRAPDRRPFQSNVWGFENSGRPGSAERDDARCIVDVNFQIICRYSSAPLSPALRWILSHKSHPLQKLPVAGLVRHL